MSSYLSKYHGKLKLGYQPYYDYVIQVEKYMDDVLDGRVCVNKYERKAVERHVKDLERKDELFLFDANIGSYHIHLFPMLLTHQTSGFSGEPFYLCGFQAFIIWVMFGWRRVGSMTRRFKEAYLEFARKQGKTALAAGLAITLSGWDFPHESRAEGYFAATKEAQAKLCWDEAFRLTRSNREIKDDFKALTASRVIKHKPTDSILRYEGCDGTTLDGLNPSLSVFDELHEWKPLHRSLMEKLQTGSGMRAQPLSVYITTAGHEDSLVWLEERQHSTNILDQTSVDDHRFVMICAIDEEDDPFLEKQEQQPTYKEYCEFLKTPRFFDIARKANPTLGEVCKLEFIQDQCKKAFVRKEKRREVLRYQFNRMVTSTERFIPSALWSKGDMPTEIEPGDWGCAGIDLARKDDFAAVTALFPIEMKDDRIEMHMKYRCWASRETSVDLDNEIFIEAEKNGTLIV